MKVTYLYEDSELEREIEEIQFSDCVGIILLGTEMMPEDYTHFSHLPFPVIFLDTSMEGVACDCVLMDNVLGAFQAVSHLIRSGHRRIAAITGPGSIQTARERIAGYLRALEENGIPYDDSLVLRGELIFATG